MTSAGANLAETERAPPTPTSSMVVRRKGGSPPTHRAPYPDLSPGRAVTIEQGRDTPRRHMGAYQEVPEMSKWKADEPVTWEKMVRAEPRLAKLLAMASATKRELWATRKN